MKILLCRFYLISVYLYMGWFAKNKKTFRVIINYILGPVLFLFLCIAIYEEVKKQPDLEKNINLFKDTFSHNTPLIFLLFFLMIMNWSVEAWKWKLLMKPVQQVSFWKALRAILSGLALSLFLPNGIGEYSGRSAHMNEGNRLRTIALNIAGSMSQLIVTLILGIISLIYLRNRSWLNASPTQGVSLLWLNGAISMITLGAVLLILVYFRLSWLTTLIEKVPFIQKYRYFIQSMETLHWKELTRILLLSFLRFNVFIGQYAVALFLFNVDISIGDSIATTCVLFLLLAILPTIPLADVGIRGEAGRQLFGLITTNIFGVVATTTAIWFVNLIIPSVAGSLFLLGIRVFKKQEP